MASSRTSKDYRMLLRVPIKNEKAITPLAIMMMQSIRSVVELAPMSPYPTVVIVVTVK